MLVWLTRHRDIDSRRTEDRLNRALERSLHDSGRTVNPLPNHIFDTFPVVAFVDLPSKTRVSITNNCSICLAEFVQPLCTLSSGFVVSHLEPINTEPTVDRADQEPTVGSGSLSVILNQLILNLQLIVPIRNLR